MDMIQMRLLIMINAIVEIKREHILTHSSSVNTHLSNLCPSHASLSTKSSVYCILHTSHSRINPHFQDWAHKKNPYWSNTNLRSGGDMCPSMSTFLNTPTTNSVQFHKILRFAENIDYYYLLYYILPHGQIHLSRLKDNLHFFC